MNMGVVRLGAPAGSSWEAQSFTGAEAFLPALLPIDYAPLIRQIAAILSLSLPRCRLRKSPKHGCPG